MFDPRITLQQQVSEQLKAHFGDKVFNTVIPRNVRLAEAPSYGCPVWCLTRPAKGSQAFCGVCAGDGGAHPDPLMPMNPAIFILPGWQNSGPTTGKACGSFAWLHPRGQHDWDATASR
jgi:hypothetical protein